MSKVERPRSEVVLPRRPTLDLGLRTLDRASPSELEEEGEMGIYDQARGRVEDDVLAALRRVSTATAWAALVRKGIRRPYMMGVKLLSVGEVETMVGRARTLRYVPLRED